VLGQWNSFVPMDSAHSKQERYDQAMFLFSQEDYDQASELLDQVLSEEPTHIDALVALSMVCYRKGDLEQAIILGHRVEAMEPGHPLIHTNLSLFYVKTGNKEMAEHHGLKAKIASWKAQPDASNEAAEDDLAVNRQQPQGYKTPTRFPDQPWKNSSSAS